MRNKIIIFLVILFNILILNNITKAEAWGPKLKITLSNEANQTGTLYLGVDTNATDGWDTLSFNYGDIQFKEDIDLPPPPPSYMYAVLIRDSLDLGTQSYVDMRGIRDEDQFFHKYRINITWYATTTTPFVKIDWGKLPMGIDSAKFRCYEWFNDDQFVNMQQDSEFVLDNQAYRRCDIYVWYNKNHTSIDDNTAFTNVAYPNPADDMIHIDDKIGNVSQWQIYSAYGTILLSSENNKNTDNMTQLMPLDINISSLNTGAYIIEARITNGQKKYYSFIKK